MAAHFSIKPRSIAVRPLALSCRAWRKMKMKSRPKILLIEDDASIVGGLKKELQAEGYEVAVATRGDNGLAQAKEQPFDVVITDLKMPGLSGLELVEQLHATKPKLPIILVTAFGTTETAIEATKLGAYDYLLKPFDMAELLDLVAKSVACNRLMSEPVEMGAPARNWLPAPSTSTAVAQRSRSSQSIARPSRRRYWRVNCLGMSAARSPGRTLAVLAALSKLITAPSSSMKSAT
ncbi:MAG: hypothetical protein DMF01_09940 [Verrucomicrobia bacterium]|nr:MAG: hypothetical protein DMF01_09940 [Verrucomicrobiota bacterium]